MSVKVLALGGSGGMGRFAVSTCMDFDNVEELIVADINTDAAIAFANSMNDKVSGIGLDVTNIDSLKNANGESRCGHKYSWPIL